MVYHKQLQELQIHLIQILLLSCTQCTGLHPTKLRSTVILGLRECSCKSEAVGVFSLPH